ncbi:MAG: 50S ribosomal protein L15 [Acidobacteria bacterium]|nr:50S ribosomal protein L15 [Acidobacteriota bacterium]
MVNLSSIGVPAGQRHPRKRVGRGMGSGHGKTSTRGHKGQMSRSGTRHKRGFEGGQMPLQRRLPKRGFHNIFRKRFAIINLKQIAKLDETVISPETLLASGVVKSLHDGLKILGDGNLAKAVTVSAHFFSQSARDKILKAGGKVEVLAG